MSEALKEAVRDHWEVDPCGAKLADVQPGRRNRLVRGDAHATLAVAPPALQDRGHVMGPCVMGEDLVAGVPRRGARATRG